MHREGPGADEARIAAALPRAETCLGALEALMADAPWLAGPELTLADLHAAPIFAYAVLAPEGVALLARHEGILGGGRDGRAGEHGRHALAAGIFGLISPLADESDEEGTQDPEVEQQRPIVDVVEVVAHAGSHLLDGLGLAAQAVDLGPAGDPGLHAVARQIFVDQAAYWSLWATAWGRGPTSDISPFSTFQSWGSSSRLVRRRSRPIRVTRGSLRVA